MNLENWRAQAHGSSNLPSSASPSGFKSQPRRLTNPYLKLFIISTLSDLLFKTQASYEKVPEFNDETGTEVLL
jgi:hypothetical protein